MERKEQVSGRQVVVVAPSGKIRFSWSCCFCHLDACDARHFLFRFLFQLDDSCYVSPMEAIYELFKSVAPAWTCSHKLANNSTIARQHQTVSLFYNTAYHYR